MPTETLMTTLREATAAHHARTEARVPVLDPGLTPAGYATVLVRFRDVYAALEAMLAGVRGWPADLDAPARRKLALLDRDLAWLHAHGIAAEAPPRLVAPPPVRDLAAAIGALYVLEGATLGGQVILRQLAPRLGVTAEAGASFYAGYGTSTGAMWKAFAASVNAWGEANRDRWDDVVAAARATFDAIAAAFDAPTADDRPPTTDDAVGR